MASSPKYLQRETHTPCIQQQENSHQFILAKVETCIVVVFLLFKSVSNFTTINSTLKLLLNHVNKYCFFFERKFLKVYATIHSHVFLEQTAPTKVSGVKNRIKANW